MVAGDQVARRLAVKRVCCGEFLHDWCLDCFIGRTWDNQASPAANLNWHLFWNDLARCFSNHKTFLLCLSVLSHALAPILRKQFRERKIYTKVLIMEPCIGGEGRIILNVRGTQQPNDVEGTYRC